MRLEELNALHMTAILGDLDEIHEREILRRWADLGLWARSRTKLPGLHLAMVDRLRVRCVGGFIDKEDHAEIWLAAARGWKVHSVISMLIKIGHEAARAGLYKTLKCQCMADNTAAQRFVERQQFTRLYVRDDLVYYERPLC